MSSVQLSAVVGCLRKMASHAARTLSDAELLERFVARRDQAAFEVLVWRHEPLVLGVCRRVLRHEHDAEDAFQAAFLALVRRAASINNRESVGSWLTKSLTELPLPPKRAGTYGRRKKRPALISKRSPARLIRSGETCGRCWMPR